MNLSVFACLMVAAIALTIAWLMYELRRDKRELGQYKATTPKDAP